MHTPSFMKTLYFFLVFLFIVLKFCLAWQIDPGLELGRVKEKTRKEKTRYNLADWLGNLVDQVKDPVATCWLLKKIDLDNSVKTRTLDQTESKNYTFIAFLTHKASSKLYIFLFCIDFLFFNFLVECGLHKIKCTQLITLLKVQTFK
jgi:hypothetical protein